MSDVLAFPAAVLIGLWLNAAQSGSVTSTDCANAIETVADQFDVNDASDSADSGISSWLGLVSNVISARSPVAVGLPVDGDPSGVPIAVLSRIDREAGVVSINPNLLLGKSTSGIWEVFTDENKVIHYDLTQTRRSLAEHITSAAKQLAASDLVGDEAEIVKNLNEFKSFHLPPHLSKRSADALELASRILIISRGAIVNTNALHSPSLDQLRVRTFEELILQSRTVLQSVVTS
jgi:hypothetical protein